jgi:hypothetical protein
LTTTSIAGPEPSRKPVATLDDLLIELYCLLDDRLPAQRLGRPQKVSDPELLCLAVAQMLTGVAGERAWLRRAPARLGHLFPRWPSREQYNRRLRRLGPALAVAIGHLAELHPDRLSSFLLTDTTPIPCGASIATTVRSEMAGSARTGYSSSHGRWYWGHKLILVSGPEGMPLAYELVPANTSDQAALRAVLSGSHLAGRTLLADRGFRGTEADVRAAGGTLLRSPYRSEKRQKSPIMARTRQWIESVFWTLKGQLSLERHGARTLEGLATRVGSRLLALAAVLWFNQLTGHPGRHLTAYDH